MTLKKPPLDVSFPKGKLDELEKLAGFPFEKKKKDITEQIAQNLVTKGHPAPPAADGTPQDNLWIIHKRFVEVYDRHGKPFSRLLGDLLDIILSAPIQEKLVNELISEKLKRNRKNSAVDPLSPEGAMKSSPSKADESISIGGVPLQTLKHYLKRKSLLAQLFLESEEYPAYLRLMKSVSEICQSECTYEIPLDQSPEERKAVLGEILKRMGNEVSREDILKAWVLLERDLFANVELVFQKTKDLSLVRPSFYEDLDRAYRDAKNLLKLLIDDLEKDFPPAPTKKEAILDYLRDVLEVYTHHHFVLKFYNHTKAVVSRKEIEAREKESFQRLESQKNEAQKLRDEIRALTRERDEAKGSARSLQAENERLQVKLQKLDPVEVEKQTRAIEAKMNLIHKEHQATLEEDSELRATLRRLDAENQQLTQKLRELNAIPDENAKSVEGLLAGKRVVIFGGIGRDHYGPLLKEAGVKDADYEWYEGYHTISQARTSEIVGRCDLIVVITSYAGHLLLWQTREAVTPRQALFLIHNSGAGSLRQQIIDKFKKEKP